MRLRRRILWSLLSGAVICVLVAWACALWSPVLYPWQWYWISGPTPDTAGAPPNDAPALPPEALIPQQPDGALWDMGLHWGGVGYLYQDRYVQEESRAPSNGRCILGEVTEWKTGWPMLALQCAAPSSHISKRQLPVRWGLLAPAVLCPLSRDVLLGGQNYLPLRPVALGFMVDTLINAAAVLLVWTLASGVRRRRRTRKGRCAVCGNDRRGLGSQPPAACPECGALP